MPFSYRRIASRTLNRESNINTNLNNFLAPVESGKVSAPFSVSSPTVNGVVLSNGTSSGVSATPNVTFDGTTFLIDGSLNVTGTITGTGSNTAGAISGDLDVSGNTVLHGTLDVSGNTTINGNLTVKGTTHTVDASNLRIEDALIELNKGVSGSNANDIGLIMNRGTDASNVFMGWTEGDGIFKFGTTTSDATSDGAIDGFVPGAIKINTLELDVSGSLDFIGTTFNTALVATQPTADRTVTFADASGTVSLITNTETLTNKTLTLPKISDSSGNETYNIIGSNLDATREITLPVLTGNDTFVFRDHIQTLTNKALTNPDIDGGTIDSTQIGTTTPDSGAFTTLSASGTLTVTGNVDFEGNLDVSGNILMQGASTFTTGTGAVALNGDVTIAADKDILMQGTGTFTSGTGEITLNGDTSTTRLYVGGTLTVANHGTGAAGITSVLTTQSKFDINTIKIGGLFCTTIQIDLTGLSSGTGLNDIIGKADTADCQLLTFADATHGQPIRIEMLCNETPAGGVADIDLYYGDTGTSTEDAVPNNPIALMIANADWVAPSAGTLATGVGSGYAQSIIPATSAANGKLLFLTSGNASTDGIYSAGKFIIKIWGAPVGYIA